MEILGLARQEQQGKAQKERGPETRTHHRQELLECPPH